MCLLPLYSQYQVPGMTHSKSKLKGILKTMELSLLLREDIVLVPMFPLNEILSSLGKDRVRY